MSANFVATRRSVLEAVGAAASLPALGVFAPARAQSRNEVLVVALDISDAVTLDPATAAGTSPPIVHKLAYDTLMTMTAGDYTHVKPSLATAWEQTPDGKGWRFTLRDGVKFPSGNPLTAADVKWSIDRLINKGEQSSLYIPNVASVEVVDDKHVDVILHEPGPPILEILAASSFVICDRKTPNRMARYPAPTQRRPTRLLRGSTSTPAAPAPTRWCRGTATPRSRSSATRTTGAIPSRSGA